MKTSITSSMILAAASDTASEGSMLMGGAFIVSFLVLTVVLFILIYRIYHSIFDVTYFGCRAVATEICVILGISLGLAYFGALMFAAFIKPILIVGGIIAVIAVVVSVMKNGGGE